MRAVIWIMNTIPENDSENNENDTVLRRLVKFPEKMHSKSILCNANTKC